MTQPVNIEPPSEQDVYQVILDNPKVIAALFVAIVITSFLSYAWKNKITFGILMVLLGCFLAYVFL